MTQAPPPRYFKEGGKREAQVMNQLALQDLGRTPRRVLTRILRKVH